MWVSCGSAVGQRCGADVWGDAVGWMYGVGGEDGVGQLWVSYGSGATCRAQRADPTTTGVRSAS